MVLNTKVLIAVATIIAAAVFLVGGSFAQADGTKPGWGYGDNNHVHTGPPGQSVVPEH